MAIKKNEKITTTDINKLKDNIIQSFGQRKIKITQSDQTSPVTKNSYIDFNELILSLTTLVQPNSIYNDSNIYYLKTSTTHDNKTYYTFKKYTYSSDTWTAQTSAGNIYQLNKISANTIIDDNLYNLINQFLIVNDIPNIIINKKFDNIFKDGYSNDLSAYTNIPNSDGTGRRGACMGLCTNGCSGTSYSK